VPTRCLIVDDNKTFLEAVRALLEREGLGVAAVASTYAEALDLFETLRPDVVLVDIFLGEESGLELARHLAEDGHGQSDAATVHGPIDSRAREPRSTVVLVGGPMASGELVQVVRMRVDRSALSALGITQNGSADTVEIDVLVGEDGVARGLRLPL